MAAVYRAREPFAYTDKRGVPRIVNVGHLMGADDPDLKGKEHLFEPVETVVARASGVVEDATAEPGKLRSLGVRSRNKAAAKAAPEPTPEPVVEAAPADETEA